MLKRTAAAIGVAVSLVAFDANAVTCAPGDVAGKWHVRFENAFKSRSQPAYPVVINTAGNMDGGILINDGLGQLWGFRSTTPIKVSTACIVTGEFGIFYGGPPALRSYAFRTVMSQDKLRITGTAITWPGYDNARIEDREMFIDMERAP